MDSPEEPSPSARLTPGARVNTKTPPPNRSRRGRRPLVAFIIGLLTVIVATEFGVRVAAHRLPEPLQYFSPAAQTLVHDMDLLNTKGKHSRITFFGTSMMRRGVDTDRIERLLGWSNTSATNVALPGAQTPLMKRWLLEEVVPRLHPSVIVWGVSSLEFNGGRLRHSIDDYNAARATKMGTLGDLDRSMNKIAISKYRDTLRDPLELSNVAHGKVAKYTHRVPLKDRASWVLGYKNLSPKKLTSERTAERSYAKSTQLVDFRVGRAELDSFTQTIVELRRRGINVVIVVMPVPSEYLRIHPGGPKQFESWQRSITDAATRSGANVIDQFVRALPDDSFRDVEHLETVPARDVFTPKLTTALMALPWWRTVFPT